jgi:hypothetical protein
VHVLVQWRDQVKSLRLGTIKSQTRTSVLLCYMREDPFTLSHFGSYDCQSALNTITFHSCLFSLASSAPSLNVLLVRLPSPFPVLKSRGRDLEPSVSPQSLRQNIAHRRGRSTPPSLPMLEIWSCAMDRLRADSASIPMRSTCRHGKFN